MYNISTVDSAIAQQDAVMQSIDSQSNHLQAPDQSAWAGQMSGWSQLKDQWTFDKSLGNVLNAYIPTLDQTDDVMGKVEAYQATSTQYGKLIAQGGGTAPVVPNIDPGPPNPKPPTTPNPSSWPWYYWVGGGAAVAAGLFVLDKFTDILGDYSILKKG